MPGQRWRTIPFKGISAAFEKKSGISIHSMDKKITGSGCIDQNCNRKMPKEGSPVIKVAYLIPGSSPSCPLHSRAG